ncbi:RagB/SusD family nutrient uptake outer membrane protein [Sphingobacterium shayense]|uniref:RagB/SusD family nutrient uptake outer membrane protein n=1 Tax=Sphingobacterium shayense TaxID=626343 RepID=UPI001556FBBC|nr:RagB/SusD family nutrient uptake outer membrane protein [Sphingobacterium shayense]NQD71299.1 RagB/SusD family nutrient uptake outer membrane protein [Sphingobacterium shayense]
MKKTFLNIGLSLSITFATISCSNLLDLSPEGSLTEPTTFTNYDNFVTYAWQFYDAFPGYDASVPNSEFNADLFAQANNNATSDWLWNRMVVPGSSDDYDIPYTNIRAINIMLDNIDGASQLSETEKNHIRSIGYFFKSVNYMNLLNRYGEVIWVENAIGDDDTDILYGTPSSRDEIAQKILDMLEYAEQHINENGDGKNTVNKHVVRALLSRFGLREGTWRKYHGLSESTRYLEASVSAAKSLVASFPDIHPDYDELFNSESLAPVSSVLLYKQYEPNQIMHVLASRARNSSGRWDLTKSAADLYLLKDGETRWTSSMFDGDKNPFDEFRNRDTRLYFTVPPPYKVITAHPSYQWEHTGNAADREYIDIMAELSVESRKTLPAINWEGLVLRQEPHFVDANNGQPFNVSFTGYRFYKFSNKINKIQNQDINDAPVFRMGEVFVNYAEAMFELDKIDQTVINQTVNKLRARGGVAALQISNIPDDPKRDQSVDPLLWEIRRERAVELMGEGFRFDDLRRWKKMEYAMERKIGRYITKGIDVPENSVIPILGGAKAGYIAYENKPSGTFPDAYYLYPIPSAEIVLNPKIKQNPGWQ